MIDRKDIREGMTVFSSDGEKLGKVLTCDAGTFIIEKGFFFPKDYVARFDDVADVSNDEIRLARTKGEFTSSADMSGGQVGDSAMLAGGGSIGEPASKHPETGREQPPEASRARGQGDEVRVPLAEEELDVAKRQKEAGEVRLQKGVVTETKHVEVPVTREEVRVEHVPASEARTAAPGDASFEQKSVSMPVQEEEVEIRKRPVVKEEVRLKKERHVEQRAADAEVRKERVDIEGSGTHAVRDDDVGTKANLGEDPGVIPRRDDNLD